MKLRISVITSVLLTLIVIATVKFADLYYEDAGNYSARRVSFKVHPGTTFKEVQADLVRTGVLTRPKVFRWAAFLTRREKKIRTGRYLFRYGESVASVLNKLVYGRVDYARVVIPEGLMMTEIASILQREVEIDSSLFITAASDSAVLADLDIEAPDLEGYLFPDTYLFDWPLSEREAIERMVERFRSVYEMAIAGLADSSGMEINEIVTLASIIQAEAVFNSEMRHISAVYHNRLKAGWRLEADPTVAYALGGVKRPLFYKDLRVSSPYNTYRVRGLPPGAICSPGRTALEAAVLPMEGIEDFYFVADGSGRHRFSKTHKEHLEAKHLIKYGPVPPEIDKKTYTGSIGEADDEVLDDGGGGDEGLSEKPAQPARDDSLEERE